MNLGERFMIFEKLTPDNNVDISGYKEALDFALKENIDITNVALTGAYGSGKSSILETYEKDSDLRYLHISLAHYDKTKGIDTKNLEGKIINQLLHQIEKKRIPKTVFKVKEDRFKLKLNLIFLACLIALWIFLIVSIINFEKIKKILSEVLNITIGKNLLVSWITIVFVLSVILLYKFLNIQENQSWLKSLSFLGNKIEILAESDNSYFDKFMNDVIYLFVNSRADVIVFEDLDRFDDVTIYEKLQEINIMLNRRLNTKKKSRKITFLYVLRDDILTSKDKTKFFDFIIPIIPVMDSSNSYEKLIGIFNDLDVREELEENILKKLTLYIDDFRLLKNIVNEYMIYNERLRENKTNDYLNSNKLLGMMVYKNLFPKDFALLQYGRSFINFVFSEKEKILDNERLKIREKLDIVEDRIRDSRKEHLQSIDELNVLYIDPEDEDSIEVEGKEASDFPSRIEFVKAIREESYEVMGRNHPGYRKNKYNLLDELKKNSDYTRRKKYIQDKSEQENLNKEKIKLEKKLERIDELWSEILQNKDLEFWEDLVEKKEEFQYLHGNSYFNLLVILLRDELIDEKYSDYIAYFYEGDLVYSDKKFIRGIFDKENIEYDYRIENPKKVIEYISDKDFRRYRILNIDLSVYLVKNGKVGYKRSFVDTVEENKEYSFLLTLLRRIDNSDTEMIEFFYILSNNQSKITENVIQDIDINIPDQVYYMAKYICFAPDDDIRDSIKNEILKKFIEDTPNFLNSKEIDSKKFIEKLPILEENRIEFSNVSNTKQRIIEGVLQKKLFKINEVNLRAILKFYDIDDTTEEFKNKNYSYCKRMLNDDMSSFLFGNNHISQYLDTYLSLSEPELELKDELVDALEILNHKQVRDELKKKYIDRLSTSVKIPNISTVNNVELQEKLLAHGNVEESNENIVEALRAGEWHLNSAVIQYINSFEGKIIIGEQLLSSNEDKRLFDIIVVNSELYDNKYIELLRSLKLVYKKGLDNRIPKSRILLLIENGIVEFTSDTLQDIRDNHSKYIVQFIHHNFEQYISGLEDNLVTNDEELEMLLQSKCFSISQEKKIIDNLQNSISINFDYSDDVQAYILEKAYDENDLKYIVEKYSELGPLSRKMAYRVVITEELKELIDDDIVKPEKTLLIRLLEDNNIELSDRKWIFANNLESLSVEEVDKQIHDLELPVGFSKALHRGRPSVEMNKLNKKIADQFYSLNWVTAVTEKGDELYISGRSML